MDNELFVKWYEEHGIYTGADIDDLHKAWQAAQPKWLDIKDAPRDGDVFIMYSDCYNDTFPAYWHGSHHKFYNLSSGEYIEDDEVANAKWQSLPATPKE